MRTLTKEQIQETLKKHKLWLDGNAQGERANLSDADLMGTDLRHADLKSAILINANIDFLCWPLWCGSLNVKVDKRIAVQLAYHFCSLDCSDPEYVEVRDSILNFANQFHRVNECGVLQKVGADNEK